MDKFDIVMMEAVYKVASALMDVCYKFTRWRCKRHQKLLRDWTECLEYADEACKLRDQAFEEIRTYKEEWGL